MAKRGPPKTKLSDLLPMRQLLDAFEVWGCRTLQDARWSIFTKESEFGADDGKRLRTHVDFITLGKMLHVHGDVPCAEALSGIVKSVFVEAHHLQPDLDPLDSLKGTLEVWDLRYRAIGNADERKGSCCAVSEDWSDILSARFSEDGLAKSEPDVARRAVADFLSDVFKQLQLVTVS